MMEYFQLKALYVCKHPFHRKKYAPSLMKEKSPVAKINLRGSLDNKDFVSTVGKILGMILPKEPCSISTKEKIT